MSSRDLLVSVGELIRSARVTAALTQRELGERAGIVGKYVSEIERGTRDLPLSTLLAIAEGGLQRRLEISFRDRLAPHEVEVPAYVEELGLAMAALPEPTRRKLVGLVEAILELIR